MGINPSSKITFIFWNSHIVTDTLITFQVITPYPIMHVMCCDGAVHGVSCGILVFHEIIKIRQQLGVKIS